jgi:hypothetical protein
VTVYVDELRRWAPTQIRCFRAGSAHMTADALEELHAVAARIGLRREWFQDGRIPHYDLTASRRLRALAAGAVFVPAKEQARRRIAARETVNSGSEQSTAESGETLGNTGSEACSRARGGDGK